MFDRLTYHPYEQLVKEMELRVVQYEYGLIAVTRRHCHTTVTGSLRRRKLSHQIQGNKLLYINYYKP